MPHNYQSFEDLPLGLQERVKAIASDDVESWLRNPIPALGSKSFLDQLNEEDGYAKVCEYLLKVEGYMR
jgi:uncharacterized protein (DUF2384 family)